MAGLVLLARATTSILQGISKLLTRIILFGDSERTISTMETAGKLDVWFRYRVAELHEHVVSWRRRVIEVDQLHHWSVGSNPAGITAEGRGGIWLHVPPEARHSRKTWPASRNFCRRTSDDALLVLGHIAIKHRLHLYELVEEDTEKGNDSAKE